MNILALDTTSEWGGVAIRADGQKLADIAVHAPDGFAHLLFPAIQEALATSRLKLSEIDCFAAASGPGSFTGVRVGMSAVKGMAAALGKPAAGVSNLRALALFGSLPLRATLLDARRGEAYTAVYDPALELVLPETVLELRRWLPTLEGAEYEFVTAKGAPFRAVLEGTRFAGMPWTEVATNLAPAVAQVAERAQWGDPALLDANYVRRSDAELFWKEER